MCETRDLGTKWPRWHTLIFEGIIRVDMRQVCPKDVKKMLLGQARSTCWRKWAAKHECEELKEGTRGWSQPWLCCEGRLRKGGLKHRSVARKLVLESGWVQKRLFDVGWSDESECQACHKGEGTEKHRLHHCPEWNEVRQEIPEAYNKWEQKARTSKKEVKWQRGIVTHPLSESQWNRWSRQYEKVRV